MGHCDTIGSFGREKRGAGQQDEGTEPAIRCCKGTNSADTIFTFR